MLADFRMTTYIEVGGKCSVNNGSALLVGEEQHLGLAGIVRLESLKVSLSDINNTVSNELVCHLFDLVSVDDVLGVRVVLHGNGVGRVHLVAGELGHTLFIADGSKLHAVDRADSEHHLVLEGKLLELALVSLGLLVCSKQ